MYTKSISLTRNSLAGLAAIVAGTFYIARWAWGIKEGVLKNMQHTPSFIEHYFFVVKLLFIVVLLSIYWQANTSKRARVALLLVCAGLTWTATTCILEAYGVSAPWGFYGSPGVLMCSIGLVLAGRAMLTQLHTRYLGKLILFIGSFYFLGSIASMILFNLLGRNDQANYLASVTANFFLVAEGFGWIALGLSLQKRFYYNE